MKRLFKPILPEYDSSIMEKNHQTFAKMPDTLTPNQIPVTNPQNLSSVYANHFGASATLSDFTMYFLELGQIPGSSGSVHKQELKAAVTLPMVSAPGLIQVLQQVIDNNKAQIAEMQKQTERDQ